MKKTFTLWLNVADVHDGDTIYGSIDQGLGVVNSGPGRWGLRLDACNARELSDPGGHEARDYLRTLVPVGAEMPFQAIRWDKYRGRLDVRIDHPDVGDLTDHLIAEQWAVAWDGTGPRPVPPWPRTV